MTLNDLYKVLSVDFVHKVTEFDGTQLFYTDLCPDGWDREIFEIRPDNERPNASVVVLK